MTTFKYQAMNTKGKQVGGHVDADSSIDAINKLREMGLYPTSVTEDDGAVVRGSGEAEEKKGFLSMEITLFERQTVSNKQLTVLVRQFATLIGAGLPLLRALRVLADQLPKGYLKRVLEELAVSVEAGSSFSDALKEYPKIFSKLFVSMVKGGELSGAFDTVLRRLADYMEKSERLKAKVIGAMFYPICILCVAGAILGFLMAFIIPKFGEMFIDMELELPGVTLFLINVSNWVKSYWYIPLLGLPVVFFVLRLILQKSEKARFAFDKFKLTMPLFGSLFMKVFISRFARTLSTLISSGVPLLQALLNVKDTVGNEVISNAVLNIHDNVREGESIVEPMKSSNVFSPIVINMIDVGEETGSVDEMLVKIADTFDEEVDVAVASLTSVIEPLMIVFLAVIVGFIVIALFLPLVSLITQMAV